MIVKYIVSLERLLDLSNIWSGNSHSTASMNDCSKNVLFKFNALEEHANFQNATISEALEKNAA